MDVGHLPQSIVISIPQSGAPTCLRTSEKTRLTSKMTQIPTHENQRIGRSPDQRANMACSMSRSIKNINASIAKIVPSVKFANLQIKRSFDNIPILEIFLPEW